MSSITTRAIAPLGRSGVWDVFRPRRERPFPFRRPASLDRAEPREGDLSARLPAWLWGRNPNNHWGVQDSNSAADANIWMAYTLLEAGFVWNEPHYTRRGLALARRIAEEEVIQVPGSDPWWCRPQRVSSRTDLTD